MLIRKRDGVLSRETIKAINKHGRELRKAEREGRLVYDDIHHIVYIREEENDAIK